MFSFFFFNDTATTEIYTLSLHDALPISFHRLRGGGREHVRGPRLRGPPPVGRQHPRSEEHTSELQSPCNLVCRLLLEKKKKKYSMITSVMLIITRATLSHSISVSSRTSS